MLYLAFEVAFTTGTEIVVDRSGHVAGGTGARNGTRATLLNAEPDARPPLVERAVRLAPVPHERYTLGSDTAAGEGAWGAPRARRLAVLSQDRHALQHT